MNARSLVISAAVAAFCAQPTMAHDVKSGQAAVYSDKFHGKPTASGKKYDMHGLTAASNSFPLGSLVHVTNRKNGKSVTVEITDIEAKSNKDLLDLSKAAAAKLGMTTGRISILAKITNK